MQQGKQPSRPSLDEIIQYAKEAGPVETGLNPTQSKDIFNARLEALKNKVTNPQERRVMLTPVIGPPTDLTDSPLPVEPEYPIHINCGHKLDGIIKFQRTGRLVFDTEKGQIAELTKCRFCTPDQEKLRTDRMIRSLQRSGTRLPEYARSYTFDNYPEDKDVDARDDIRAFVEDSIQKRGKSLFIHGLPGTGKTSLASSSAQMFIQAGFSVYFTGIREYIRNLQNTMNKTATDEEKEAERLVLGAQILILDDLGAESGGKTDWALGKVFDIIEERLQKGLLTIITSNDSPSGLRKRWHNSQLSDDIQQQSGRIYRRFTSFYTVIEVQSYEQ